jgi:competence protein ComEC
LRRPDVLVDREGETAALRSESGSLIFPPATAASYSVDNWLLADGDSRSADMLSSDGFKCDLLGCIGTVKGKVVALIRHPAALEEDCRIADIVIAPFTIGRKCRAARVIVDRRMLKQGGAQALYIEGLSIRAVSVASARGHRPWVPEHVLVRELPQPGADNATDDNDFESANRRRDSDPDR